MSSRNSYETGVNRWEKAGGRNDILRRMRINILRRMEEDDDEKDNEENDGEEKEDNDDDDDDDEDDEDEDVNDDEEENDEDDEDEKDDDEVEEDAEEIMMMMMMMTIWVYGGSTLVNTTDRTREESIPQNPSSPSLAKQKKNVDPPNNAKIN